MDDVMRGMEERLEALVPKGISDHGRERLEQTVEELAAKVIHEDSGSRRWKWGIGLAAGFGLMAGAQFLPEPATESVVAAGNASRVVEVALVEEEMPSVETMAISQHVEGRIDEGWVEAEGAPHVYRVWSYEVMDEEEILDEETGFVVTVYSQREERIPVRMTSL